MRLLYYGDEKGGGIVVIAAPDSHVEKYSHFLLGEMKLELKQLPKKADRAAGFRTLKKNKEWILPPARGTNKVLVPAPGAYPCDVCEFAQYNQLCQHQSSCTAFVYWTLCTTEGMGTDLKEAFCAQFGRKKK